MKQVMVWHIVCKNHLCWCSGDILADLMNSVKEDVEAGWYNSPSPVSYIVREDVEASNQ